MIDQKERNRAQDAQPPDHPVSNQCQYPPPPLGVDPQRRHGARAKIHRQRDAQRRDGEVTILSLVRFYEFCVGLPFFDEPDCVAEGGDLKGC